MILEQNKGESFRPAKYRVFLVDDDADDRLFGTKKLMSDDSVQEVKAFSDGIELIRYMKNEGFLEHTDSCLMPTIIVVDVNMPKMDGFHVLGSLKGDPVLDKIPVIVVSSVLTYDSIRKALDLGADAVFRKPMDMDKLNGFFKQEWQWQAKEIV